MAPKIKFSKEDIIEATLDIVRKSGSEAINARTIASTLECSTQPIFSNFNNMEELRLAVVEKAEIICNDYIKREVESNIYPVYKASGMAYIRFAKEEKELFKLLYMRDRAEETSTSEESEINDKMVSMVNGMGLDDQSAQLFHLEMWMYVHGIATLFATNFLELEWELVPQGKACLCSRWGQCQAWLESRP